MPIPWNTDYTTLSGSEWASVSRDPALAAMFGEAMSERIRALTAGNPMAPVNYYPPRAGYYVLQFWFQLRNSVWNHAARFVRQTSAVAGETVIPSWRVSGTRGPYTAQGLVKTTRTATPFPPTGFTRRWPREIWSLSCPGAEGQVARFSARLGSQWMGAATTDPLFDTPQTTPEAERVHTTRFFRHDGANWQPAASNVRDADVLSETRLVSGFGAVPYPPGEVPDYSGDYFGPVWLNELRDAINLLVWTAHGLQLSTFNASGLVLPAGSHTETTSQSDSLLSPSYYGDPPAPSNTDFRFMRTSALTNPFGLTRDVSLWWKPGVPADYPNDWDNPWALLTDFGATASPGPFEHGVDPGVVKFVQRDFDNSNRLTQFLGPPAALIQKWDVPGGFRYTAAT